jgi:phosphoribosylanthranilate isomerase
LGVDAIGLVFYANSPRAVDPLTARQIVLALPPFVTPVGLFVNADPADIHAILRQVPLGMLQFHGNEDPETCASFGLPFIKAVPMGAAANVEEYARRFATAAGLLLDSHDNTTTGGSGRRFNWQLIPDKLTKPIVLAGGLTPDNIAEAIKRLQPFAVDVSSGVESTKGVKDLELMRAFMKGVETGGYRA